MENVNKCLKGIGLITIFKNVLWENDKTLVYLQIYII